MTDGITLLGVLPGVTLKVVELIKNLTKGSKETAAIQRLQNLEIDLNVIEDVISEVNLRNPNKDGVQRWAEVAEKTVLQADKLVQRIDEKMKCKWRQKVHKVHSFLNHDDINELDSLLKRFDVIKSHSQTILTLTNGITKHDMYEMLTERITTSMRGIN